MDKDWRSKHFARDMTEEKAISIINNKYSSERDELLALSWLEDNYHLELDLICSWGIDAKNKELALILLKSAMSSKHFGVYRAVEHVIYSDFLEVKKNAYQFIIDNDLMTADVAWCFFMASNLSSEIVKMALKWIISNKCIIEDEDLIHVIFTYTNYEEAKEVLEILVNKNMLTLELRESIEENKYIGRDIRNLAYDYLRED